MFLPVMDMEGEKWWDSFLLHAKEHNKIIIQINVSLTDPHRRLFSDASQIPILVESEI